MLKTSSFFHYIFSFVYQPAALHSYVFLAISSSLTSPQDLTLDHVAEV